MCCTLVAPKVFDFRRNNKVRNGGERLRKEVGVNEVDFKTELNSTEV
jgi:hypothetical protein